MTQRKDGMCSGCKTERAHAKDAYCLPCRDKRRAWQQQKKCPRCGDRLCAPRQPYCRECKRKYDNDWYHRTKDAPKREYVFRVQQSQLCSCRDPKCNGLTC